MPSSSNHATLNEETGTQPGSVEKTQIASERMLVAIGKVERAIDEKISRDIGAKNSIDNSAQEINELKAELARLNSENDELRQAVNHAGARLDNAIETLSQGLSATE